MTAIQPAVWFPAIRCGSGTDVFTERLCAGLNALGIRAEITWLPHRAEYAPWSVPVPKPPAWANVVHVNSWLPPRFIPRDLPVVTTLHSCVHDPALISYKTPARRLYHALWVKAIERANLARARCITAVSHYTAQAAQAAFGVRDITVIHNGVDTERFHPVERLVPHRPFRLLYVGNWDVRKGVDLFAPIMTALGPEFELCTTADRRGAHLRYALPSNCRSLGRLAGNDLVRTYQEADALLFPSRLEGLPLTVIEAMACGVPVIAARCSSLPEVVADGETGLLCPVDDASAFVAAVRILAQDKEHWRAMRQAARESASTHFAATMQIERWVSLYDHIIDKNSMPDETAPREN
ncbi:glycosyltransferase family 4 protein [Allochromatium tepidum]|uniref:Glycosyl transferase family 1 n=1 Tax=Allochromatium tepidum TaxID=553982 RepID=A0ABM7QJF1_9GAMM|nr:glycosyltransferase family 4 protein [Allochromatium tepidum]BCU05881.1 glycosyl transferase family 1 [Allochromatium tepidum]